MLGVIVILGIHPPGTTELYDSGEQFLEHVNAFWVAIHFLGALFFLAFPIAFWVWAGNLATARARLMGKWAVFVGIIGTAVGTIHLVATDTTTFVAFAGTFEAGGNGAIEVGADLLLRLHAATLTAWTVSFFFAWPLLLGTAARMDGRFPKWVPWLAWLGSSLSVAAVLVTLFEGQWTTLSEMGLFRPSVTVLFLWILVNTWWMRRGSVLGVGRAAAEVEG